MTNAEAYFAQTLKGYSEWWRWIMGFWFIIIAWLIGQVLTFPIFGISMVIAPEKVQEVAAAMYKSLQGENAKLLGQLQTVMLLAGFGGTLFYALSRNTEGMVRQIFAVVTGIFVIMFLFSVFYPILTTDQSEMNAKFMELIALSPWNYAFMLMAFGPIILGAYLVQKLIHHRTFKSLLTAASRFRWKRAFFALGVTWLVYGILTFIAHISGLSPLEYTFDKTRFFGFALASLLLIPIQSAAEEIVFRGYLNQWGGHFLKNKWIVFIITSALFASMHLANPEAVAGAEQGIGEHLLVMSGYFLFGFILCMIVYYEGGLEAAIGVHAANNLFAALFVNYEGSVLPTPTFFLATPNSSVDTPIIVLGLAILTYIFYKTRQMLGTEVHATITIGE